MVLLAALAVVAAACATKDNGGAFTGPTASTGPPVATDPVAARLLPAGLEASHQLKVGAVPGWPPLVFLQGGSVQGLDDDLIQAIGAKLGLTIALVSLTNGAASSGVDVVLPGPPARIGTTPPAGQVVPFLQIGLATVVKAGHGPPCTGPVAVVPDVPFPGCPGPHVAAATAADGVAALQQGRANALVTDYATSVYLVQTVGSGKALALLGPAVDPQPVGLILTDAGLRPAVQAALAAVVADGTYAQILKTWGLQAAALPAG